MRTNGFRAIMLIAAAGIFGASPVSATLFTYVISGTTTVPLNNPLDGLDGGTVIASGQRFTLTYVVDDALASAVYSYGATGSSANGGYQYQYLSSPPVSATLAIGGQSFAVRQGDSSIFIPNDPANPGADPDGEEIDEADLGSVSKSAASHKLDFDARYTKTSTFYNQGIQIGGFNELDEMSINLTSSDFTDPDFRQTGSFALDSSSIGLFVTDAESYSRQTDDHVFTAAGLAANLLTVTVGGVPEPSSWAMMLFGLGSIGTMLRRRRTGGSVFGEWQRR